MSAKNVYPPLELLKRVTKKYPNALAQMALCHNSNGMEDVGSWPTWCYVPMAAAVTIVTNGIEVKGNEKTFLDSMSDIQQIASLAVWRQAKEVYVLDEEMEELLSEQNDQLNFSSEILYQIPYSSFYIQFNNLTSGANKYHGVFVHLEYDINNGDSELRLLFLRDDLTTFGFPIHISEENLEASIARTLNEASDTVANIKDPQFKAYMRSELAADKRKTANLSALLRKALQAVLYVCASNADVEPNPEQNTVMKHNKTATIRDRYAEIRKWDVGVRVGSAVRAYKKSSVGRATAAGGTHSSPRPHIRRGHWHNYWTGKRDDPEKRKLKLEWTAPTYIGYNEPDKDDDTPVTLHHVLS